MSKHSIWSNLKGAWFKIGDLGGLDMRAGFLDESVMGLVLVYIIISILDALELHHKGMRHATLDVHISHTGKLSMSKS